MRPNHITAEDIARWDAQINSENLGESLISQATIREVCYAGLFLAESLADLGCSPGLIMQLQFEGGKRSFGRDPWEVHAELLKSYKLKSAGTMLENKAN